MQTAMQELIERLNILSKKHHKAGLLTAIEIANSLLEMEKQMIIKANRDGVDMAVDKKPFIMGEQYYQETFVSKGSDFKQFSLYEHKDTITSADTPVSKTFLESVPKQETLYTEEQVREAISKSVSILVGQEINLAQLKELIIKSLKQPKQ